MSLVSYYRYESTYKSCCNSVTHHCYIIYDETNVQMNIITVTCLLSRLIFERPAIATFILSTHTKVENENILKINGKHDVIIPPTCASHHRCHIGIFVVDPHKNAGRGKNTFRFQRKDGVVMILLTGVGICPASRTYQP